MHPTACYDLMQGRVADMHHQAERGALARRPRSPPRAKAQYGRLVLTFPAIAARRVLTAWPPPAADLRLATTGAGRGPTDCRRHVKTVPVSEVDQFSDVVDTDHPGSR